MAESSSKDVFSKLLAQLAGQLWQLETTLQAQALNNVFSEDEKRFIKTYQDLFDALVAKQRLGPRDLSLLSIILKQQSRRSHLDFLRPFYEAGFGHQGLEDGGRQADKDGPVNPTRPRAFGFIRHRVGRGHKKRPAVCCETRFKLMLHRVGANVNSEELSALKLLCQDAISRRQLESCPDCLDLLTALCKQQCITGKRPQFLYRLLQDCGRQDLTSHIDEYIYVCLMSPGGSHHQAANTLDDDDFDADLNALLKRDRRSQGKNYQFRRSLKKLGDEISQSDLKNMKYISGIPEGKLEAVGNVFDFFLLMEEMGVLSRSNISFLERILDEKVHLIIPFYEKGFGRKKLEKMNSHDRLFHIPIETIFGMNPDMNFKRLIKTIGTRLTSDDVKNLKFLCRDATAACLEEIESGMDLLACLEKSQKISATDIEFLAENLESIGRKDLQKYLTLYKRSTPRSSLTSTSSMAESPLLPAMGGFETTDEEVGSGEEEEEEERDNAEDTTQEDRPTCTCTCTRKLSKSKSLSRGHISLTPTLSRGQVPTPTLSQSQLSTPSSSMTTVLVDQTEFQQLKEQVIEKETLLQAEREKHTLELKLQRTQQENELLKIRHECDMLRKQQEIDALELQREKEKSVLRERLAMMEAGLQSTQDEPP